MASSLLLSHILDVQGRSALMSQIRFPLSTFFFYGESLQLSHQKIDVEYT